MAIEFQFDGAQDFQLAAIEAVADLFVGQPRRAPTLEVAAGAAVVPNRLDLADEQWLENLAAVQADAGLLPVATALARVEAEVTLYEGVHPVAFPNFSVEMETGTGKTYVYIRTALTLAERYGLTKFIIVVPSVAVREGVMKTFRQIATHLAELPGTPAYRYSLYNSADPGQVRGFASSNAVELMVMTIDSFARAANVIRQPKEGNAPPIHTLQAVRPVLILDEPQNMESEGRLNALADLNPLFALRYSATHRNPYDLVHRLSPWDAYTRGLVKRIEVAGPKVEGGDPGPYVRLDGIETKKQTHWARVTVDVLRKTGTIDRTQLTLSTKPGKTDLRVLTGDRIDYEGFRVAEINRGGGFIRFENGEERRIGEEVGPTKEAIFEAQIRYTVEEHFRKQKRLRDRGLEIKVLSLFFIDHVDSFTRADGLVRRLFVQAFDDAKAKYPEWADREALAAQASYFATVKKKGGAVEAVKAVATNEAERAAQAREFDLIMRRKEALLSFDEPVAFIFSHSALKEGWDNPNVFQICTLREVGSETERRQQIGRGVRLPIDATGARVFDTTVNVLTVAAGESYERYVAGLQDETLREGVAGPQAPKPDDARAKVEVRLRKALMLSPEFGALWDRIKHRTRYAVALDSKKLIADVVAALNDVDVLRPRVVIQVAAVEVKETGDRYQAVMQAGAAAVVDLEGRYPLPNLIGVIENLMEATSPAMRVSRKTLLAMLAGAPKPELMVRNPQEFAVKLVKTIKNKLADQLVGGIRYEKDGTWFEQSQFLEIMEVPGERLFESIKGALAGGTHLYDHVEIDAGSSVERDFVGALENDSRVKVYAKLPRWFEVRTPIGEYRPDWAIVTQEANEIERLYLVRETKSTLDRDKYRPDERRKIDCGKAHFRELGVDYAVMTEW